MSRTSAYAVKDLMPHTSWRVEIIHTEGIESIPLQGWRQPGDGDQMSRRERIADLLHSLDQKGSDDTGVAPVSPSEVVLPPRTRGESDPESNLDTGNLSKLREDVVKLLGENQSEEGTISDNPSSARLPGHRLPLPTELSPTSLSSDSKLKNADRFESGKKNYESKNNDCIESGDTDSMENSCIGATEEEANNFQIFQADDVGERKPASILDLVFDGNDGQAYELELNLIASSPSGNYMRKIDSWGIRVDEQSHLMLYVRDTKGSWIKLKHPLKGYEASIDDSLIIVEFLELAAQSNQERAEFFSRKILEHRRVGKPHIRRVLRKYYTSVVKKFARTGRVPRLRKARIIKNMEKSLQLQSEPSPSVGKTLKSGTQKKLAAAIQNVSKRKRVVESDLDDNKKTESLETLLPNTTSVKRKRMVISKSEAEIDAGTDSEDLKPLFQRMFVHKKKKGHLLDSTSGADAFIKTSSSEQQEMTVTRVSGHLSQQLQNDDDKSSRLSSVERREVAHDVHDVTKNLLDAAKEQLEATKENVDHVTKNLLDAAKEQLEATKENVESGEKKTGVLNAKSDPDHASNTAEQRVLPDTTGIYGGEDDMPDDFEGDDEDVGDAAFCAICDDGGDLLFCDGPCVRSFHASREAASGSESKCRSLGLTDEQVKEMGSWLCPNCEKKVHQCFICGNLGSSEGENKEVYLCDVALCGRFYHPECLGEFTKVKKLNIEAFVISVKDGFCCPAHKCRKCSEGELEGGSDNSMKLAKCRRCPKAYHKNCLPPSISFEETDDEPVRAWEIGEEDEPVKRLVIYCTDHIIVEELNTPRRNHLKWPKDYQWKKRGEPERTSKHHQSEVQREQESLSSDEFSLPTRHKRAFPSGNQQFKRRAISDCDLEDEAPPAKRASSHHLKQTGTLQRQEVKRTGSRLSAKSVLTARKDARPYPEETVHALRKKPHSTVRRPLAVLPVPMSRDAQMNRIQEVMAKAAARITLETVHASLFHPSCYVSNTKKTFIRRGDLLSILNAAKRAVEKVNGGGSIEEAKRICPRDLLIRLIRGEDALRVYFAPLLHGTRYTSYGRHFTNPDKLKEIIERIHWYIDEGDMVVDFCCGANDFSTLLKAKLDSVGKTCEYKNFDIHPPRNTFGFTKGDWFQNQGIGFAAGKKLVMGLNPPFGHKALLATKFVEHALKFRPKLLVLIVPPETMDDGRRYADFNYNLVWEDKELLSGKSFYLPGSLDRSDEGNIAQWNNITPPLYLWCPAEMLTRHQQIAYQHNHIGSLPPGVNELPPPTPRALLPEKLQTGSPGIPAQHQHALRVEIPELPTHHTPTASPLSMKDIHQKPTSAGLASLCRTAKAESHLSMPRPLPPPSVRSQSPEELSTSRSSSSSQGGQSHLASPHVQPFSQNVFFDGRDAGLASQHVPIPKDGRDNSAGVGHADFDRTRIPLSMQGSHTISPVQRLSSSEGHTPAGIPVEHSGYVPTEPTLYHHGRSSQMQRPTHIQQGPFPHTIVHTSTNPSAYPRIPRNSSPHPPRPISPGLHTQLHPSLPSLPSTQLGRIPSWPLGAPPAPSPPLPHGFPLGMSLGGLPPLPPRFPPGMHGAHIQHPVHLVQGWHGGPHFPPHGDLVMGRPGVPEYVPHFMNPNIPHGGRDPLPSGRHNPGGESGFGSGGWIED